MLALAVREELLVSEPPLMQLGASSQPAVKAWAPASRQQAEPEAVQHGEALSGGGNSPVREQPVQVRGEPGAEDVDVAWSAQISRGD